MTDTPLQPQGVVTPYESPGNTFSEAQEVPNSQQQDIKDTEETEDMEDTLHMHINSTDRSVGGGATERELASGDTFQELPMVRKEQKGTEGNRREQKVPVVVSTHTPFFLCLCFLIVGSTT